MVHMCMSEEEVRDSEEGGRRVRVRKKNEIKRKEEKNVGRGHQMALGFIL